MRTVSVIDEIDQASLVREPDYIVQFWFQPAAGWGWQLDSWEVTEVDSISEVLDWAESRSNGRPFVVLIPPEDPEGIPIRLHGQSPNIGGEIVTIEVYRDE